MKISVISATMNSAKTVQDTIDSVLRQSYQNVEHIIKDGGSAKDDTVEIIKKNASRYESCGKSLKWVSEKDFGIYDAMNKGVEISSGDVIGILNSDDFYTSDDILEKVAKEFDSHPELEAVYGDIHFVKDKYLTKCTRYYSSGYFRPWMMRFGFMPAHPAFYVRRDVYEKCGLYDLEFKTSSDFEWMVRLFIQYRINAKYLKMDFVTMRVGGESTAGIEAKKKVNHDIAHSLKKHGIYTNQFFQMMRYLWKGIELVITKIKY